MTLDERLIGTKFALPRTEMGTVTLYGIHYHYTVLGEAAVGTIVVVTKATALTLYVEAVNQQLSY